MNAGDIAFPNLGIYLENVPKSFRIFGFEIALYGVIITIGVLSGLGMALYGAKISGQDQDDYWDLFLYDLFFSVLGARIYYVVFSWDQYRNNLKSIINLREGGLAIYGAVIAAFLTLFVYTRIKKRSFLRMGDTAVPGLILGQIIGRWGNFVNREAFGEYTDGLFTMRLPAEAVRMNEITETMWAHMEDGVNYIQVHPTFLYESLWNLVILVLMMCYRRHKKFEGEICLFYLGGYGIGRFLIERLRTDQLHLWHTQIPVSQMLGLLLFIGAVAADVVVRRRIKKKEMQGENDTDE